MGCRMGVGLKYPEYKTRGGGRKPQYTLNVIVTPFFQGIRTYHTPSLLVQGRCHEM